MALRPSRPLARHSCHAFFRRGNGGAFEPSPSPYSSSTPSSPARDDGAEVVIVDPWSDEHRGVLAMAAKRRMNCAPSISTRSKAESILDQLLEARDDTTALFATPLGAFALANASVMLAMAMTDDDDDDDDSEFTFINAPKDWTTPMTSFDEATANDEETQDMHLLWLRHARFPRIGDAGDVDVQLSNLLTHCLCEHPPPSLLVHSLLPPASSTPSAWSANSLRRSSQSALPFVRSLVDVGAGGSLKAALKGHLDANLTKAEIKMLSDGGSAVHTSLEAARMRGVEYCAGAYALAVSLGMQRTATNNNSITEEQQIRIAAACYHALATAQGGAVLTDLLAQTDEAEARRSFAREAVAFAATRVDSIAKEDWPSPVFFTDDAVASLQGAATAAAANNAVSAVSESTNMLLARPVVFSTSSSDDAEDGWHTIQSVESALAFMFEEHRRNPSWSLKGRTPSRLAELSQTWGGAASALAALNSQGERFQRNHVGIRPTRFEEPVHIPELGDQAMALVRFEEILSSARLEAQGQLLGNCLRGEHNMGYNLEKYCRRARSGVSSFWSLEYMMYENGEANGERVHVALLVEIWNDERIIHQAEGPRPRAWPTQTAWELMCRWAKEEGLRPETGSWELDHWWLW